MKANLALLLVFAAVLTSGCLHGSDSYNQEAQPQAVQETSSESSENTVEMTSTGFSPQTLTIKKGETVTWVNKNSEAHWPASAMHPTHKAYPGSGMQKCGTEEELTIFDACAGIQTGESWSFTFNEVGSWKYHDHLNPSLFGTISVE